MENFIFYAVGACRILCSKYCGFYDSILNKSGKSAMDVKQSKNLALEIFKTVSTTNPEKISWHRILCINTFGKILKYISIKYISMYAIESLKKLGSFIWNSLSNQIKNETEYTSIMEFNEKVVW